MNENFGSIYVDIAKPISVNDYFANSTNKLLHNMRPKHLTFLTKEEKKAMQLFANEILYCQQKHCTINTFNLVSLIMMDNLMRSKELTMDYLITEVLWIKSQIEHLGAFVAIRDIHVDISNALNTHNNLVFVDKENRVQLVHKKIILNNIDVTKLKGYALSENTMTICVPYFMLQIYLNATLHYFINASIIMLVVNLFENITKGNQIKIV